MFNRFTTEGEARCRAVRRRDFFTSLILATVTLFTVVLVLLAIRTALQPWTGGHIIVIVPPESEKTDEPQDKIKQSHSHAHYRPVAPKKRGGARAKAIRAMTFSDLSLPDPGPEIDLTGGLAMEGEGDFGEGVGTMGGAGQGNFFGIKRQADRFAFVVDVSGSMDNRHGSASPDSQRRIDSLKKQMRDSIAALPKECEFAIIFFNDGFWGIDQRVGGPGGKMKGRIRWKKATDRNKFQALDHISRTGTGGGTKWVDPLAEAVKLQPKPQVLYLLSDGEPSDWSKVRRHLASIALRGIAVDTIALESCEAGAGRLREMAEMTGGSYRRIEDGQVVDRIDSHEHPHQTWALGGP